MENRALVIMIADEDGNVFEERIVDSLESIQELCEEIQALFETYQEQ